jgi:dephospho-CoA kinase
VVVPLLLQTGFEKHCDKVVSVIAPRAQRVERVMSRDGIPAAQVEERMAAQLGDEEYEKRADIVIRNDGDLAALERAANSAWAELMRLRSAD